MGSTFQSDTVYVQSIEEAVDVSSQRRILAWKGGLKMIQKYPLTGIGYGVFDKALPDYAPVRKMPAHNTYIQIAAEMGLPALFLYLLVLLIILINTRKLYRSTNDKFYKALALGFLGSLGGVLMANVFGGRMDSQAASSYFWILAALVFKALYLEHQDRARNKKHLLKIQNDQNTSKST